MATLFPPIGGQIHGWQLRSLTAVESVKLQGIPGLTPTNDGYEGRIDAIAAACHVLGMQAPSQDAPTTPEMDNRIRAVPDLRVYQADGIRMLAGRMKRYGCALLADEMGLGKTRQAIRTTQLLNGLPCVIVARASVRETWREELKKCGVSEGEMAILGPPSSKAYEAEWDPARIGKAKWFVISYALLDKLKEMRFAWESPGSLVIDEMHEVKGRKTKRSLDVEYLARMARYRLGISGTPFDNSPVDLHRILNIMLGGNRFGTYTDFTTRYCNGQRKEHSWDASGSSNEQELRTRLGYYMVRREKREVATELPAKTRQIVWVDDNGEGMRAFQALTTGHMDLSAALIASLKAKIPAAIEKAQEAKRFLLLTWMREHAEEMARELDVPFIHGGLTTMKRSEIVKECADRKIGVVATADSVGVGVDGLQHVASIGIMHSFDWRPMLMAQREDRLHRLGQQSNVHWIYLGAKDTVDEPVLKRLVKRLDAFRLVMGKAEEARGLRDTLNVDPAEQDEGTYLQSLLDDWKPE